MSILINMHLSGQCSKLDYNSILENNIKQVDHFVLKLGPRKGTCFWQKESITRYST